MPILTNWDESQTHLPQRDYMAPEKGDKPTTLQGFYAAMQLENPIVNFWQLMQRPVYQPNSEFHITEELQARPEYQLAPHRFFGALNLDHFEDIAARIRSEREAQETLAGQGVVGSMALSTAAAMLSPTVAMPFMAQTTSVSRAVASAFGYGVLGATIDEAALYGNQSLRTPQESLISIGSAGLINGLLGSGVKGLQAAERAAIEREIQRVLAEEGPAPSSLPIPKPALTHEGAVEPQEEAPDVIPADADANLAPGAFKKTFGWLSPLVDTFNQRFFPTARWAARQFSSAGMEFAEERAGKTLAPGGEINEILNNAENDALNRMRRATNEAYKEYMETSGKIAPMLRATTAGHFSREKLSYTDFANEGLRVASSKELYDNAHPAVRKVADEIRALFAEQQERLIQEGLLKKGAGGVEGGDDFYVPHMLATHRIKRGYNTFLGIVKNHFMAQIMEELKSKELRLKEQKARLQEDISDLSVETEAESIAMRNELGGELKAMMEASDDTSLAAAAARRDRLLALRARQRRLDQPDPEIAKDIAELVAKNEANPVDEKGLKEFLASRRRIKQRLSNLSKSKGEAAARLVRREEQLAELERLGVNSIKRYGVRARRLLNMMDRLGDAAFKRQLAPVLDGMVKEAERYRDALKKAVDAEEEINPSVPLDDKWAVPYRATLPADLIDLFRERSFHGLEIDDAGRAVLKNEDDVELLYQAMDAVQEDLWDIFEPADAKRLTIQINRAFNRVENYAGPHPDHVATLHRRAEKAAERAKRIRERLDKKLVKAKEMTQVDREKARAQLEIQVHESAVKVKKLNENRAFRVQRLKEKIANDTPEAVDVMIRNLAAKDGALSGRFEKYLEDIKVTRKADGEFEVDKAAEIAAKHYIEKVIGGVRFIPSEVLHGEVSARLKERSLHIPFDQIKDFVEYDLFNMLRTYVRQTGSDIEFTKRFGDPRGDKLFKRLQRDLAEARDEVMNREGLTAEQKDAEIAKINRTFDVVIRDIRTMVERLRFIRYPSDDVDGWWYRLGRAASAVNVLRLLGRTTISSFPDTARIVMLNGMRNSVRGLILPLMHGLKGIELTGRVARDLNLAAELMVQGRFRSLTDAFNDVGHMSAPERGLQYAAGSMGHVALFTQWTYAMKSLFAMASVPTVHDALYKGKRGELLRWMGWDKDIQDAIRAELEAPGGSDIINGIRYPNLANWNNPDAIKAWRTGLMTFVNKGIVTPGVELPGAADASILGKLFFQLRSFTIASTYRTLIAMTQERGVEAYVDRIAPGLLISLALGAVSYYTWAYAVGGEALEKMKDAGFDEWADEMLDRSGYLGAWAEVLRVAERVPMVQDYARFSEQDTSRYRGRDFSSLILGPSADLMGKVLGLMTELDDPTAGTVDRVRRIMAYNTVPLVSNVFDAISDAAIDRFNLPETRK